MLASLWIFLVISSFIHATPVFENETIPLTRGRRMVVIPGTCKIMRSDKSLPPWRGRCGGFKYCMFDYTEEDGRLVRDRIVHDTCWKKGHFAECNVTQVVIREVRCLFDQGTFRLDGTHPVACLDSKEPGIPDEGIIRHKDKKDPQIIDSSKCDASAYIG